MREHTKLPHATSMSVESAMAEIRAGNMQKWSGAIYDHLRNHAYLLDLMRTRAAPPAMDREAVERIERFVSLMVPQMPLAFRRANEAAIVQMANDFADIRAALSTLSADAIRQGEGIDWSGELEAYHPDGRVETVEFMYEDDAEAPQIRCTPLHSDGTVRWYNYDGSSPGTEWRVRNATPASHASDGGKA